MMFSFNNEDRSLMVMITMNLAGVTKDLVGMMAEDLLLGEMTKMFLTVYTSCSSSTCSCKIL